MQEKTLSFKEIADALKVNTNTLAYRRDLFKKYIPVVEMGNSKIRYAEETLGLFKIINDGFEQKISYEDIEKQLMQEHARLFGFEVETTNNETKVDNETKGIVVPDKNMEEINNFVEYLKNQFDEMKNQNQEIKTQNKELVAEVKELKNQVSDLMKMAVPEDKFEQALKNNGQRNEGQQRTLDSLVSWIRNIFKK